ncbi:MAG: efflux RND transporter periplasmic adaptor subunit [Lysobacteraceae bacterium]
MALGLGLITLLAACGDDSEPTARRGPPVIAVTTTSLQPRAWSDTIEALGTARAKESLTLTAKVTETVDRVNFADGDMVSAGDVLVDLSGRAEVAQLEEAQASYKEARQQYERQSDLVKQGTIARSQLDSQIATRDAAKARVDAIRARLADRVITAPFDGVLGFRQVSPGTLVSPGTAIATLDDISTIKLDFSVPERFLSQISAGQRIDARSAAWPAQTFEGTVTTLGSRVDPVTRSITVRADIPNPDAKLRPGMLLTVELYEPERQTLAIPEISLVQIGGNGYVFRVGDDSTVQQVEVEAGARQRGLIEVTSGLAAGDRIVVDGVVKLRSGSRVIEASANGGAATASNDHGG